MDFNWDWDQVEWFPNVIIFFKSFCFPDLRKLELRKVDRMTQITDDVFELVFRHTTLTHFIIQSDEPIQNVSSILFYAMTLPVIYVQ